jgi:hypothetical protein
MDGDLPLIDPAGLSAAQLSGHACLSCGKRWPRPVVPAGRTEDGEVLQRCEECVVMLEPGDG